MPRLAQIFEQSSGMRQVCVSFFFSDHCIKQIDSMLPWICSVIDHRGRWAHFSKVLLTYWIRNQTFKSESKEFEVKSVRTFPVIIRSQRTSKCGENISDNTSLFSTHFDVICDLLLNRRTATWNLFVQ